MLPTANRYRSKQEIVAANHAVCIIAKTSLGRRIANRAR
jgi:hypothetical protein